MFKLSKVSKSFALAVLAGTTLLGCSGGEESVDSSSEAALSNDTAFAYVERSISTEAQANIDKYTSALTGKQEAPLDVASPYDFRPGARLVIQSSLDIDAFSEEILAEYFGSDDFDVKDLNTSPDGTKLIFAAHGPEGHTRDYSWNIYEYDFATKTIRRIIEDDLLANAGHDTSPTYADDGRIVYSSDRSAGNPNSPVNNVVDEEDGENCFKISPNERPSLLHSMTDEGEDILQLTYGNNHDLHPFTMNDGRVVFVRWSRSYEQVQQCGTNFQKVIEGQVDYTEIFAVSKTAGLSKPEEWADDAICQFAFETPVGAVVATNNYTILRITSTGESIEQLYDTVSVGGSDEAFLAISKIKQSENGKLVAVLQHEYNQFLGGNPVELQEPQSYDSGSVFGSLSPKSVVDGEVDLYPNQVSVKGWYSALETYRDGSNRALVSWSKCTTIDGRGISSFCRDGSNADDIDTRYGLWVLDNKEMLPIVKTQADTVFTDVAIAQPHGNQDFPYEPFDASFEDNLDSSKVICDDPSVVVTPTPTPVWTPVPTPLPTPVPTETPIVAAPPVSTVAPTPVPTVQPTPVPTPVPTVEPTPVPTVQPTPVPTAEPTPVPTAEPTPVPTAEPTPVPTAEPTPAPTAEPTAEPTPVPTAEPTPVPTAEPTPVPTAEPTPVPTAEPTPVPTAEPTPVPTAEPTPVPTAEPTPVPTAEPTPVPTVEPTPVPTPEPTPVVFPTPQPTPTAEPTPIVFPTPQPTPTPVPTVEPTPVPTATPDPCSGDPVEPALPGEEPEGDVSDICDTNTRPVAVAGEDASGYVGDLIVLDGRGSSDADGDELGYAWSLVESDPEGGLTLALENSATPILAASSRGEYTVQLLVNDGEEISEPSLLHVTINNRQPVANAGNDVQTFIGETVALNGSNSGDADGDELTYAWSLLDGNADGILIGGADTEAPEIEILEQGVYELQLVVNDGELNSEADTVLVSVNNRLPVAQAGDDVAANVGGVVELDGSSSYDPEGNDITYAWTIVDAPEGAVELSSETDAAPTITINDQGTYVVALVVNDGIDNSATDTLSISVGNVAPIADAGNDQPVHVGSEIVLDGSNSTDADGDALTYRWSVVEASDEEGIELLSTTDVRPRVQVTSLGFYRIQLIVNDGFVDSEADEVVLDVGNIRPVADAGDDQSGYPGDMISLDGSGSSDIDGDLLTYRWSIAEAPAGSSATITSSDAVNASFVPDVLGQYSLQLIVNDGFDDSEADIMLIDSSNMAPVANAGEDSSARLGESITLDGSGSSDAEGDELTYSWSIISQPEGGNASLTGETTANPSFEMAAFGDYVVQLIVNDGYQDSAPDVVMIASENLAPVADAGDDQEVEVDETVSLSASGSSDPEGMALSYQWSFTNVPDGANVSIDNAETAAPSFEATVEGTYVAQVTVSDGELSDSDTVTITVNPPEFVCDTSDIDRRSFPAVIRDFNDSHPDFEYVIGSEKGIVAEDLGVDNLPVYANPDSNTLTTTGVDAFNQWYRDVDGVNQRIPMEFEMYINDEGVWEYRNWEFFPIDDMGWGNQGRHHNYHFTLESHLEFDYEGNEHFMFAGDDDLWVFINGKLAIDIGGVHSVEAQEIYLPDLAEYLGIEPGNRYTFDLFFAERHTVKSTFKFQTNINLECGEF